MFPHLRDPLYVLRWGASDVGRAEGPNRFRRVFNLIESVRQVLDRSTPLTSEVDQWTERSPLPGTALRPLTHQGAANGPCHFHESRDTTRNRW